MLITALFLVYITKHFHKAQGYIVENNFTGLFVNTYPQLRGITF